VAIAGGEERQPEVLLREADVALSRAKQQGRARFEVYDELTHRRALERLRLQVDLRVALEQDELHLVYQPLVSLHDGHVCGVEALLRWQHLTRGAIPPSDFIPEAEASGLIVPIGLHVLRTACREAAAWAAAGTPVPVSVNVAVQQLARRGFAGDVQDALIGTGLAPSLLALEITETTLMEANDKVLLEELRAVREMGVAVHLDDFGTGYSSLGSLRDVPLDVVKVDRSFVSSLGIDPHSEPILQAITTMAHELGLRVVAEGIENSSQRDLVAQLGCDEAQGYLFAPPAPADAVAGLLDAARATVAR
jgi:EAL domain-containing protein (putative c-di-GMP-specific phosphodiesterase class I)